MGLSNRELTIINCTCTCCAGCFGCSFCCCFSDSLAAVESVIAFSMLRAEGGVGAGRFFFSVP